MDIHLVYVGFFVVVFASLPLLLKWFVKKRVPTHFAISADTKIISTVAVGTSQRVVTIEVGLAGRRRLLVLGVTAQSISCLHSEPVDSSAVSDRNRKSADEVASSLNGPIQ